MNITFDLETLGRGGNAPIVQIGAVKFEDDGTVTDKFLRTIEMKSLQNLGFDVTYDTIEWWFNQNKDAIDSVFGYGIEKVSLGRALFEFQEWLGKPAAYNYWSHATFDPPILSNAFTKVGKNSPIPFRLHRDIRTLSLFAGKIKVDRVGNHHNALDDCIYQAEYISKGLQIINSKK